MTREIELRVWDKKHKIMSKVGSIINLDYQDNSEFKYITTGGNGIIEWEDAILIQFTGLLDKNGKKIFEGDIIQRIFQEKGYQICEVKFEEGTFGVEDYDHAGTLVLWALRSRSHHFVIIGDIHNNPELLNNA